MSFFPWMTGEIKSRVESGEPFSFTYESLRAQLRDEFDFEPRLDHMAFFGTCRACRDKDPSS